ncbi:MAG: TolC family protein [Prolixibacteraceae bacterium]
MNFRLQIFLLFVFLSFFRFAGIAQEKKSFDILKDNIESMLPPLSALIDSAIANNPGIRSADLQIKVKQYKLSMDKALWTKNLGLQTDVRYGTFDVFSTNTSAGQNPSTQSTLNSQLNYGFGGFIKIPIYEALSRKDMIRSDKIEIEQTQNLVQSQRNEIRQLVITRYNDLVLKHKVFVIKTKYAETIKINMQLAEKEFQNGVLNLDTYSRVCDTYARSEADYEGVKMDFQTAYMTFEVIVGMKFNIYQ